MRLCYQDTATFVEVAPDGYGNNKTILQQVDVPVIFLQNTGFTRANYQEATDSDAICYPDYKEAFIVENYNRLEGMYLVVSLFGVEDSRAWYKIISVSVNRDHLLCNEIDNVQLALKKTTALPGVS